MKLTTDGRWLRDEGGRIRVLHGINLVHKGREGSTDPADFADAWTGADLDRLAALGFTVVRFGVNWAAGEPAPGDYSKPYLDWVERQLDQLALRGFAVFLDAHQDLYSQRWANGAPDWATLTGVPFDAAELWSDAYITSPAVHEALDAWWANAPGPGGVGLQDRFAAFWAHIAERFGAHPAVSGYDVLNEPTPGADAEAFFGTMIGAFAEATAQPFEVVLADFDDPERKFAQLALLDDPAVHRAVGGAVAPLSAAFETDAVAPLFERVVAAIRAVDEHGVILREHNYFANTGVPSGVPPLADHAWAYSPHGYDLTVDTPAIVASSNTRASTIFERADETGRRLGVPVIVGEWGAFDDAVGIGYHADHLQDVFDRFGWSWLYWCWTPSFADSEAAACLRRPRPLALAASDASWGRSGDTYRVRWDGVEDAAASLVWAPHGEVTVTREGEPTEFGRMNALVVVPAGLGRFELVVS